MSSTVPKAKKLKPRNSYSADQREKARKYYLMGLNMQEISKLMDGLPVRTLEKWQTVEQWTALKNCKPIKQRALELKKAGRTMQEISETLKISRVTAWRYIKNATESD
ncbi:MAG: helix-turn-helix domain containing protein [Paludibacter sp.]|nr:helix-turn-helix domain containing protein [Paludibacter sp.]